MCQFLLLVDGVVVKTCALLDPGSNRSFCSSSLAGRLNLCGSHVEVNLETLGSGKEISARRVSFEVKGKGQRLLLDSVLVIDKFPNLSGSVVRSSDIQDLQYLEGIDVPHHRDVDLLIGQDYPHLLKPLEIRSSTNKEPYAVRTVLGWTVNGPLDSGSDANSTVSNFIDVCNDSLLEERVEQFWKIDTKVPETQPMSVDERQVVDLWDKTTSVEANKICMRIPFAREPVQLPNNREVAVRRLQGLTRRFNRNPDLLSKYKEEMNNLVVKGYAEEVTPEMDGREGKIWYLPHHNVVNNNKPEKFRIVYDCAAKHMGVSLNQVCLQGPDYMNNLLGVLLRFREGAFGAVGDIRTMFHQVKVASEDRSVLQFLWWKDGIPGNEIVTFRMTVHLFGGVWSPSCAMYALQKAVEDSDDPEVVEAVRNSFYVDDCLLSGTSEDGISRMISRLCRTLDDKTFYLTKWVSNSQRVLESIPSERRAAPKSSETLQLDLVPGEKVLGVFWNITQDTFGVRIKTSEATCSKRGMLSVISSLYDPLGMVAPVVLQGKLMFQEQCRANDGWDERLSPQVERRWLLWVKELQKLQGFAIERCFGPTGFAKSWSCELHHFCDASMSGYGCVTYLRVTGGDGETHCSFVLAKSKLAPMKQLTIPRLELSGAVLAVKIDGMLKQELTLQPSISTFWTDSMIVLGYIRNRKKRFKTFVANRVARIHEGSVPEQWHHVDTKRNPADHVSRGLDAEELLRCKEWSKGPEFLSQTRENWPKEKDLPEAKLDDDVEVKLDTTACVSITAEESTDRLFRRYSSWFQLRKAVAWLRRFIRFKRDKTVETSPLTTEEIQAAERAVLRYEQRKYFAKELVELRSGAVSTGSPLKNLEPILSDTDGLLRIGSRLRHAPIADEAKQPVIIPRDSRIAELIVEHVHCFESGHSGKEHVLSLIRQRYWIPRGRALVKRVSADCGHCKRMKRTPVGQRMGDLPEDRITPWKPAFSHIGVDCFGPVMVKRGRSKEKRYGCLFTCSNVRAVHIEMLHTMETDSFINSLTRFAARRGYPEVIRSDNGTNFTGAEKEMQNLIAAWADDSRVRDHLLFKNIKWIFNPPLAPHMGGFWERQVRTVKRILTSIIGKQVLDDERLTTIFCEVEAVVNNRPLTYVSDDPKDPEPLSPNHLLLQRSCNAQ